MALLINIVWIIQLGKLLGNNPTLFIVILEMYMTLDMSILNRKPFRDAINKLEELLFHSKAVLLGAGASKCAGLPLTYELTEKVLTNDDLSADSKTILVAIQLAFSGAKPDAHIEDYLSELIDWLAITARRTHRNVLSDQIKIGEFEYNHDQLLLAIEEIKKAIFEAINEPTINSEIHERFIQALHRPVRPGKENYVGCIDYLIMNYDSLIEDSLALSRLRYVDGIEGGVSGWWNPEVFKQKDLAARVFKLHGSINWVEEPSTFTPVRIASYLLKNQDTSSQIMIWPASTKYRETQLDPYAYLMDQARSVLNPKNGQQKVLLIAGYSFGDAHINLEVERGLKKSNGNLTVVIFTSEEGPTGVVKKWHDDPDITEQILIFARKGFYHADQQHFSENNIEWWTFENLTQIIEGGI